MDPITIQDLWKLLLPSETFDTRGRYEKCLRLWEGMDEARHQRLYGIIEAKKQKGEFVHPNPCFALDDAMQEEECAQAKRQQRQPQFLKGDEGGDLVQVLYDGKYKICSRETMNNFNLHFIKNW